MALTDDDFKTAATELGCNVAALKAVADVESPKGAFLSDGRLTILFEAHWFSYYTKGRFDKSHPTISSPKWNQKLYKGGAAEWGRLEQAIELDRKAALMSASFGQFQIMGFNFGACGFTSVEDFVAAMKESEERQLAVFIEFIKSKDLEDELQRQDWHGFARIYNGKSYASHGYHTRIEGAYDKFKEIA